MLGTIIAMGLGILVGAYAILGGHTPTYDPSDIMQGKFVVIGSLVMFFSVVTTNIMSLYSISMSSMSVLPKLKFSTAVIFWGLLIVAGTFMQDILMASFFDWVLLVGALMIPVFAIVITDYYLLGKRQLNEASVNFEADSRFDINIAALLAYILGATFAIFFTYVSPLEFGSTAPTFIFSAAIYFVFKKLSQKRHTAASQVQDQNTAL
tara:strand:+ start:15411 stop:16034 length:624 start_codon:yes stop_codon:yes gene_type:complete